VSGPELHTIASLSEGQEARFVFTIDEAQMNQFARISGDDNPLHCDDAFARASGFRGRVVYGALLIAKVSRMIGMQLPGRDSIWNRIQFDFAKPLYVGQEAELIACIEHVSEATRTVQLRLELRTGGARIASGKAGVSLRNQASDA